ncbi:MAG: PhzF family phenazine biosynthesis protein [Candidatus Rokubacteria bacterium]|nr:PhzF family phenazine biosynthesis protein [Candidatus Rokubacteria bacterium]MBI3827047.1 PhzF family phenazine biosynthesis protein [Candidatus Rokubacteria bacterium]
MTVPVVQVDAFTDRPFAGNPAAVCLLDAPRVDDWLEAVARELNLPATAFLVPARDGFDLRWFTTTAELTLCGHGTLASAHVLWETGRLAPGVAARFHARCGLLTAERRAGWIEMDFPAEPARETPPPPDLLEALGVSARLVARNRLDYLVEVASESVVRAVAPDLARLMRVDTRGVIVTAPAAKPGYDFVSRFFAPRFGLAEDFVTGSAHCCLGPLWAERLGRRDLVGRQLSSRGGVVRVGVRGERVLLAGQAVTVFEGTLLAG